MNKMADMAIMNRSVKNTATVHMRDRYFSKFAIPIMIIK